METRAIILAYIPRKQFWLRRRIFWFQIGKNKHNSGAIMKKCITKSSLHLYKQFKFGLIWTVYFVEIH